jgi:hypothetical protein
MKAIRLDRSSSWPGIDLRPAGSARVDESVISKMRGLRRRRLDLGLLDRDVFPGAMVTPTAMPT